MRGPPVTLPTALVEADLSALAAIERRVLWIATNVVHHANARPNLDGSKVGGHQASSASVVTLMTALYFHHLRAGDRVSVKPHAAPVLHAIQYLLGRLDRDRLGGLRAFGGLQAYPSRTKDPDPVDFSTGSVGLGAVAPLFAALGHQYALRHFGEVRSRRFFAVVGDAELDEGNVWEALLDEALRVATNVTWIVDLNRQSLDRVVPGIRAQLLRQQFANCGWNVIDVKYGRELRAAFEVPGGERLREALDTMSNEDYQRLVRSDAPTARRTLRAQDASSALAGVLESIPDGVLVTLIANLGGHDLGDLIAALEVAERTIDRPSVIFAYTLKGYGLPFAADPSNHSKLLTSDQMASLRHRLTTPADDEWASFPAGSPEGLLCVASAARLHEPDPLAPALGASDVPRHLDLEYTGTMHTQQAFGRMMVQLAHHPDVAARIVTAAPDVATSTNLTGWVLKRGQFASEPEPGVDARSPSAWHRSPHGQHVELGISEMNLFMLLAMFGLGHELSGQQLVPVGTVYDPFVCRGLDAFLYGAYSGSRFIVVGTPSGVSLAPEGGAHQSTVTPSIAMELPNLDAYEPCFAQELEWVFLEALRQCVDVRFGRPSYLRLTTKPVNQEPFFVAKARLGEEELHRQVLAGGYRLVDWSEASPMRHRSTLVHVVATGAMVPEAVAAAGRLHTRGIAVNVVNLTSPRMLHESWREHYAGREPHGPFDWLIPEGERHAPIVTVIDGASHALSWFGSVYGAIVHPLGVDAFGQSGNRESLYRHYGIDSAAIEDAAVRLARRSGWVER